MAQAEEIDINKLRYVLYARRSTTDEGSQVRSIPDQIKYCNRHAEIKGLNVVATFSENGSAKKPDKKKRPKFYDILEEIENGGKYDAILAYSPDRLSRNMLDGGRIINMLDESTLKDLQFPTHHFTNDPSGKLTLGIMFSISKHFSDDLSQKVNRGVSGNFDDGKSSGSPKWGYDRNVQDGLYKPNEWFSTIQEAWYMRVRGSTNKAVQKYLLEKGYHRLTKITKKNKYPRKIYPTEKSVGVMFGDPFYYGILEQTNQTIDLRTVYDFEPMIEEDLYNQVQALAYTRKRDINPKKMFEFKPLARMVYCGVCKSDKWMLVGKNKPGGSAHHVLTYRCDNTECTRSPKSVRAKYIFESIYALLSKFELSDEAYERYSSRIDSFTDEKIIKIKQEISSKRGAYSHKKKELDELSLGLSKINRASPAYEINENQINKLAVEVQELDEAVNKLREKIANPSKIKLSKEQFLNQVKSAPDKMRAGSAVEKDRLARILFLNLTLDNEKRLSVIWKEPFANLVKAIEMSSGADERT
jgi:DNA invertase Pin-like site-specific DNA recombinase/ACT domain-containing protein